MNEVCPIIMEWKAENIYACTKFNKIDRNYQPRIMRDIENILFPNLKKIILYFNNLESVEAFHRVYMP